MKRLWVPVLVALLVALLLGVPGATGQEGVAADSRVTVRNLMIPAAAFIPTTNTGQWHNNGYFVESAGGIAVFTAPVTFPVQTVSIKKITLYALDNDYLWDAWVSLCRAFPPGSSEVEMGSVSTSGNSATDPWVFSTTAISPRQVNTGSYGAYLWIGLDGPGLRIYGIQIQYSY